MTDPDLDRRAMALLDRTFDLPEAEREHWIGQEAGADFALRERTIALLRAERSLDFPTGGAALGEDFDAEPPDRIGPYRIIGLIGRGGMGAVFRAQRDAGDFEREVAIKLIKPGLLSHALIERFAHERQTLAALTHPGIARLYDGGQTEEGTPYFVMELVEGRPLREWLKDENPDLERKLALFLKACEAVAFAHRNLVVHRDLTPSNILVDEAEQARLIDFGIAKPVDPDEGAGDHSPGSLDSLSLTPGYAAPERRTSSLVSTAADIFALGRVLEQMVQADARNPELAAIIARATQDDPQARYPTVDALAGDVAAWRGQFPVTAFPGGFAYRWRKFARRNRRAVIIGGTGIALVLGAFALTGWSLVQAIEANREEAQRFGQLRSLARYLVYQLNDRLSQIPGNTVARAELASEAQRYFELLANSPDKTPELQIEVARGLIQLARIQGDPTEPNLGEVDLARANLERAMSLLSPFASLPEVAPDRASALVHLAMMELHGNARETVAEQQLARSRAILEAVAATSRGEAWHRAWRQWRIGRLEWADVADRTDEIEPMVDAFVADRASWPRSMRASGLAKLDDAIAVSYRALARSYSGHPDALALFLEADRHYDALLDDAPNDPNLLYRSAYNAFQGFGEASRTYADEEGGRLIGKAAEIVARLRTIESNDDAMIALELNIKEAQAQSLRDRGRFAEAITLQRTVVEERLAPARDGAGQGRLGDAGFSLMVLGIIARDSGNRSLACESWAESLAMLEAGQRSSGIIGFHASYIPGLKAKQAACTSGGAIDTPMRE